MADYTAGEAAALLAPLVHCDDPDQIEGYVIVCAQRGTGHILTAANTDSDATILHLLARALDCIAVEIAKKELSDG